MTRTTTKKKKRRENGKEAKENSSLTRKVKGKGKLIIMMGIYTPSEYTLHAVPDG